MTVNASPFNRRRPAVECHRWRTTVNQMKLKISNSPKLGKSEESDLEFQVHQMECGQELAFWALAFSCSDQSIQKLRNHEKY
jgi:hypothetical protein